jgi:hypothetical protein
LEPKDEQYTGNNVVIIKQIDSIQSLNRPCQEYSARKTKDNQTGEVRLKRQKTETSERANERESAVTYDLVDSWVDVAGRDGLNGGNGF